MRVTGGSSRMYPLGPVSTPRTGIDKKALSERDICTKFITPAIVKAGWDLEREIREEVPFTDGRVIARGKHHTRGERKRADYILNYQNIRLAIVEAKPGAERYLGDILVSLGKALVEAGRFAEARPHLERAMALREASTGLDPVVVAEARLHLSRALWGEGGDRPAARAQAQAALDSLAGNESPSATRVRADLERFLSEIDEGPRR